MQLYNIYLPTCECTVCMQVCEGVPGYLIPPSPPHRKHIYSYSLGLGRQQERSCTDLDGDAGTVGEARSETDRGETALCGKRLCVQRRAQSAGS